MVLTDCKVVFNSVFFWFVFLLVCMIVTVRTSCSCFSVQTEQVLATGVCETPQIFKSDLTIRQLTAPGDPRL